MTTEQTAQQLELAAQILRTGHPWGYRITNGGCLRSYDTPLEVITDGNLLIPLLATPPDNRPLHNPDNLTAEQVGVGYRLTVEGESVPVVGAEWWCRSSSAWLTSPGGYLPQRNSVRVPLKTPWPEPEESDPYAEPQTKTVPLGPEDVPPGSVFRGAGEAKDPDNKDWYLLTSCSRTGIRYWRQSDSDPEPISWLTLKTNGAQINRSLSKGQWNPDAWEPCSKTIPA